MHAEWSVELGREDEALEFPWSSQHVSPDQEAPRYYDLKRHPELMVSVPEAYHPVEMGEFLSSINSNSSIFESVKCDLWFTEELSEEDRFSAAHGKGPGSGDGVFPAATTGSTAEGT